MSSLLFTENELEELSTPYPDKIRKCIQEKNPNKAIALCKDMKESRIILHDFFADSCTILWSWIGEHLGEDILEDMFRYVFEQSAKRQLYSIAIILRLYQKFSTSLLAKSGWRSHSCFEAGEYPGKFSLTEDDEKFTFHMQPCGSGSRLWQKGWYEPDKGGKLSEKSHWWTYNREGFPYYCMHCPFLNEALPYEALGYLMWPVDELQDPKDVCRWHIYKNPNMIPEHYYERLGLKKVKVPEVRAKRWKNRYFSEEELLTMVKPIPDRIIEKIQQNDYEGATALCKDVKDEFLFLHDLYVNMLVATLTFISDKAGESALGEVLAVQFEKCMKEQLAAKMRNLTPKEKIRFLALMIFGVDNCNQTGLPRGKFTISETDKSIVFTLNPCGSGGRLLRGGAYKPMATLKRWREGIEDSLVVVFCKIFPLPDSLLEWFFSLTGGYFTERKPYAQGVTKKDYPWSFRKKDIPYYCCQCGNLQDKLGESCLKIHPPDKGNRSCIWKIDKNYLEKKEGKQ